MKLVIATVLAWASCAMALPTSVPVKAVPLIFPGQEPEVRVEEQAAPLISEPLAEKAADAPVERIQQQQEKEAPASDPATIEVKGESVPLNPVEYTGDVNANLAEGKDLAEAAHRYRGGFGGFGGGGYGGYGGFGGGGYGGYGGYGGGFGGGHRRFGGYGGHGGYW